MYSHFIPHKAIRGRWYDYYPHSTDQETESCAYCLVNRYLGLDGCVEVRWSCHVLGMFGGLCEKNYVLELAELGLAIPLNCAIFIRLISLLRLLAPCGQEPCLLGPILFPWLAQIPSSKSLLAVGVKSTWMGLVVSTRAQSSMCLAWKSCSLLNPRPLSFPFLGAWEYVTKSESFPKGKR